MGSCCDKKENNSNNNNNNNHFTTKTIPTKQSSRHKTSTSPSTHQTSTLKKQSISPKITVQDIDNDIHNWVERTKRNHKKSFTESNNISNEDNEMNIYNESEIAKDFCDDNNDMLNSFSEINSTIHLTHLTKEFYMKKIKLQNINSINNPTSFTLFNVLEELECNLPSTGSNNHHPVKIFISPLANKTPKGYHREFSFSKVNSSTNQINKITANINMRVNGSKCVVNIDEKESKMEETVKSKDDAQIFSRAIDISITTSENVKYNNDVDAVDLDMLKVENMFSDIDKLKLIYKDNVTLNKNNSVIKEIHFGNIVLYANINKNELNALNNYINTEPSISWKKVSPINNDNIHSLLDNKQISSLSIQQTHLNNSALLASIFTIINHDITFNTSYFNNLFTQIKHNQYTLQIHLNNTIYYLTLDSNIPFLDSFPLFAKVNTSSLINNIHFIEKAFYVLNQCNSELNSNFCLEIYHLLGWIPERHSLIKQPSSRPLNKDILWNSLYTHFTQGNLLICFSAQCASSSHSMSNSSMYSNSISTINPNKHMFFPVIALEQVSYNKIIKVKALSQKACNILSTKSVAINEDTFNINLNDITNTFSEIYLCWNPQIYRHVYSIEGEYTYVNIEMEKISKFDNEDYSLENNPQYVIRIPPHPSDDIEIKLVLMKYVNSFNNGDTISFKLYKYEGYPIISPDNPLRSYKCLSYNREIVTDIIKFESSETTDEYVIVIIKNDSHSNSLNASSNPLNVSNKKQYCVLMYTDYELSIAEVPKRNKYKQIHINDLWELNYYPKTTDILYDVFLKFPQYKLSINNTNNKLNHLQIKIETKALSQIMICLINSDKNLFHVTADEFLERKSPNIFTNSVSYLEVNIPNGDYLLMCLNATDDINNNNNISQYPTSGRTSPISHFSIAVSAFTNYTNTIILKRLLPISPYTHIERRFGEWTRRNNYGKSSNANYLFRNPGYEFIVNGNKGNKMYFYLKENLQNKYIDFNQTPHIYLMLFKVKENDTNAYELVYDGSELPCSFWGFYIENIELTAGRYILLCMNHNKKESMQFEVIIHSELAIINGLRERNWDY